MGNCVFKDYYSNANSITLLDHPSDQPRQCSGLVSKAERASMIKVVTTTGGIMELYAPITAEQITSEFPNHGLFLSPNPTHPPLVHNDSLSPGHLYYLLPLSHNSPMSNSILSTPYRMSVDVGPKVVYKNHLDSDFVPRYNGTGVWKVRLVINPEHLSEILSQDNKTQQLIESVRTVAKCGTGSTTTTSTATTTGGANKTPSVSSVMSNSNSSDDQRSLSSCNFHRKSSF